MGTLELMTEIFQDVVTQLTSVKQRLDELEIIQEPDDILWTKDDLKKYSNNRKNRKVSQKKGYSVL